jgi:hypothetical protein
MYKQHLLSSIEKEINVCKRLYTKVPKDQMQFRPKEGMRSMLELLQYLAMIGSVPLAFWLQNDMPFGAYFGQRAEASKQVSEDEFLAAMDKQINEVNELFSNISENDLFEKEVAYPWGAKASLGEGIINTSIKFLTAYKLQLFTYIKLCTDQQLGTADAWVLTEIEKGELA